MEKNLLPVLCFLIVIVLFNIFKPTSDITYQDMQYVNSLKSCTPYKTEGKLTMIGIESSKSIIQGAIKGRCKIQTVNKFAHNKVLSTVCYLNKSQLNELATARQQRIYEFGGYNDAKIISKLKKEGVCGSYTLKGTQWIKTK